MRHALQLEPTSLELSLCCLTACCLAKTPTAALIARVGCGRGLLYAWVSLSRASLLVVGIRACKVMGETRFAGSVFTRQSRRRSIKCALCSSFVRHAPMPFAIATTSVRSHGGCAAEFADNFF